MSHLLILTTQKFNSLIFILEIGVGLAGFGVAFLFLGVLLLFDKGLLAIGNVTYIDAIIAYYHETLILYLNFRFCLYVD